MQCYVKAQNFGLNFNGKKGFSLLTYTPGEMSNSFRAGFNWGKNDVKSVKYTVRSTEMFSKLTAGGKGDGIILDYFP